MFVRSWFKVFTLCRNPLLLPTLCPCLEVEVQCSGDRWGVPNLVAMVDKCLPGQESDSKKGFGWKCLLKTSLCAEKTAMKWGIRSSSSRETRQTDVIGPLFRRNYKWLINSGRMPPAECHSVCWWPDNAVDQQLLGWALFGAPNQSQLGSSQFISGMEKKKIQNHQPFWGQHIATDKTSFWTSKTTIWKLKIENWVELRMSYHPQVSRSGRHPATSPQCPAFPGQKITIKQLLRLMYILNGPLLPVTCSDTFVLVAKIINTIQIADIQRIEDPLQGDFCLGLRQGYRREASECGKT